MLQEVLAVEVDGLCVHGRGDAQVAVAGTNLVDVFQTLVKEILEENFR